jgi:hypothetical protein
LIPSFSRRAVGGNEVLPQTDNQATNMDGFHTHRRNKTSGSSAASQYPQGRSNLERHESDLSYEGIAPYGYPENHSSNSTNYSNLKLHGSTTFRSHSPRIPERRNQKGPTEIRTGSSQKYATFVRRHHGQPTTTHPLSVNQSQYMEEETSSVYSQDGDQPLHVSPLNISVIKTNSLDETKSAILKEYVEWRTRLNEDDLGHSNAQEIPTHQLRRSKSRPEEPKDLDPEALYSPLTPYFADKKFPVKKGGKTMIGDNGWLERTAPKTPEMKKSSPKKSGLLDSIKKIAKEMVN